MVEGIGWSTFRCWKPKFKEVYLVKCGHITFNNHYQCKGCMQRCLQRNGIRESEPLEKWRGIAAPEGPFLSGLQQSEHFYTCIRVRWSPPIVWMFNLVSQTKFADEIKTVWEKFCHHQQLQIGAQGSLSRVSFKHQWQLKIQFCMAGDGINYVA